MKRLLHVRIKRRSRIAWQSAWVNVLNGREPTAASLALAFIRAPALHPCGLFSEARINSTDGRAGARMKTVAGTLKVLVSINSLAASSLMIEVSRVP